MSPYLRFGMISIRRMVEDVRSVIEASPRSAAALSAGKFLDELIWREFYAAVLFHFPRVAQANYRQVFDRLPWKSSAKHLSAWQKGQTGFPLVDAGMRQLNRTGWMHNRVRMVVASFLTKDLMIDWKEGERYFAEKLLDIETASNNGGWQWSASTGVDPKPLRIFNPTLQAERFDPDGDYIRATVPELASVPTKYIHAPQTMPPAVQKDSGCLIGRDYPAPIVDHKSAAGFFRQEFARVKKR
jgi:deoxyribodipyrimidine photo-lyase